MKYLISSLIMLASGQAAATVSLMQAYPSCDLQAQHSVKGETRSNMQDPREAHISVRIDVLQADIGNARKARYLTQRQADTLWQQAAQVGDGVTHFVKQQGFLSAAERASYDRELDKLAGKLCHHIK